MVGKKNVIRAAAVFGLLALSALTFYIYKSHAFRFYYPVEGNWIDLNFRDLGASINSCLGDSKIRVKENRIFRASGFFSGQSCAKVGAPDEIISLNYLEDTGRETYCVKDDGLLIGQHYNLKTDLNRIEHLKSWRDPHFVRAFCLAYYDALSGVIAQRRLLIHCDAGRDRTGAFSVLLLSSMWESLHGENDPSFESAMNCDYEKSKTLSAKKKGRMLQMLMELEGKGGSLKFLSDKCQIEPAFVAKAAQEIFQN
jgi:hypothetical protein